MPENVMTFISRAVRRRFGRYGTGAMVASALVLVSACDGLSQAMSAHTDVVARAAGRELRVEDAAQALAMNPQIPADPQVVRALADLWVDYSLLATAVMEDTTLAAIDMAAFLQPMQEQAIVTRLREQVVQVDTVFPAEDLRRLWISEGPSAEIRARHILLRMPTEGTSAQRDSVRQIAESLRQRAVAGETFGDLAREFSQDPGSAVRGGDLGYFGRGRMVQPFEEAAFALQPGEVGPVVESPFGYHVILVEDRRQQPLDGQEEQFRQFLVQRAIEEAEGEYLELISADANVQVASGALDVVREIANRPDIALRGRAAERAVATYQGGEYSAGRFQTFIRTQPPQVQGAFASAPDDQLETGVLQLVQIELLLREAESRGITLTAEEEEQIQRDARENIAALIDATGFLDAARQGADPAAIDAHVQTLLRGVITGEMPFVPLGRLGVSLRDLYGFDVNEGSLAQVITRLEEIRVSQPAPPMPMFDDGHDH